jgi:hypothetical protein
MKSYRRDTVAAEDILARTIRPASDCPRSATARIDELATARPTAWPDDRLPLREAVLAIILMALLAWVIVVVPLATLLE